MIPEFSGDLVQWLRGFYAVGTSGSISSAAKLINRSKPAVTSQIRSLEEAFGVNLFTRQANGMILTAEGRLLLEHTQTIFQAIRNTTQAIGRDTPNFTLTANPFILPHIAGRVAVFSRLHPGIAPCLTGNRTRESIAAVQSGEADLGIIPSVPLPQSLYGTPAFSTSFVLITAKDNPFKVSKHPGWKELAKLPLLSFAQNGTIHKMLCEATDKAGVQLHIVQYQKHFSTIAQLASLGHGVTIVDKEGVNRDDLLQIPPHQTIFINCASSFPTDATRKLVDFVDKGGQLITTDWALKNVLEPAFPGYVSYNQQPTSDEVVRIEILDKEDPVILGFLDEKTEPVWWLEGSSYPKKYWIKLR